MRTPPGPDQPGMEGRYWSNPRYRNLVYFMSRLSWFDSNSNELNYEDIKLLRPVQVSQDTKEQGSLSTDETAKLWVLNYMKSQRPSKRWLV